MMLAKRYPFDLDALNKGDTISADELERITRCERTSQQYDLRVLSLKENLERELAAIGKYITCQISQKSIRLLTDPQASAYNYRRSTLALRDLQRSHRRLLNVDPDNLSVIESAQHEHRLLVSGRTVLAAVNAKRAALRLLPHKRTTPTLTQKGPANA